MFIKKKNKIQKKYILETEGGTRNSPLSMYFPLAPVSPMPGLFLSKKKLHTLLSVEQIALLFFLVMQFVLSKKESNSFYQKKDSHPKM